MNIKDMPKVVLHLHLDGSLSVKLVQKWLSDEGKKESLDEVSDELMVKKDCHSLNDYLTKFELPCRLLKTAERLGEATYELFKKLASEGVCYAEVRFAPLKHISDALSLEGAVDSVISGMNKAVSEFAIKGGIILCCMRGDSYERNIQIIDMARKKLNVGVCGVDLAGAEAIYPTKDYLDLFYRAKELGIPFTIHAGEAAGEDSIKSALLLDPSRIGHGVKIIDYPDLIQEFKKRKILLEQCVSSNYQTEAVNGKHPIEKLYRLGIAISINTDNDTVSNTDIIQEYERIIKETSLDERDILLCNYNSINYIFASDEVKNELRELYSDYL